MLFAGSDGGAGHWVMVALPIEATKINRVEPHAYLASIIVHNVNGNPQSRIGELLPWAWRHQLDDAARLHHVSLEVVPRRADQLIVPDRSVVGVVGPQNDPFPVVA